MPARNVTCSAQWGPEDYVIQYNGGTAGNDAVTQVAMDDQPVHYAEENVVLKTNTYEATGYTFNGWICEATSDINEQVTNTYSGAEPYQLGTYNYISNMICTAQWVANTYDIIYEAGTCEYKENESAFVAEDALTFGENYDVLGLGAEGMTVQEPIGTVFMGWRSNVLVQSADRFANETYGPWTTAGDLVLTGVCELDAYNVTYDCGTDLDADNVTPTDDKDYNVNDTVEIQSNTCKKRGWTATGWICTGTESLNTPETMWSDSGVDYFAMPAEDVECVSDWEQDVYHVTYDCGTDLDEDSVTPQDLDENNELKDYYYNDEVTTKANTCKKTGYDFTKWNCAGADINAGGTFGIVADTTCVAQWKEKKYPVTYQSGNCEAHDSTEKRSYNDALEYGKSFEVKNFDANDIGVVLRNGYQFLGWNTVEVSDATAEAEGFNAEFVSGTEYGPWTKDKDFYSDEGLTLYAVCKPRVCTIEYKHIGGHFKSQAIENDAMKSYTINTTETQDVYPSVHDGYYVFDGWYNNSDLSGDAITTVPGNYADYVHTDGTCGMTLYAKWVSAGEIVFDCVDPDLQMKEKEALHNFILTKSADVCDIEECEFEKWVCDDGRTFEPNEYDEMPLAEILVQNTVTCTPVQTCTDVPYRIYYEVYDVHGNTKTEISTVELNGASVLVSNLRPNTYTTGNPVEYPNISLSNCSFKGWYENADFTGRVFKTPGVPEIAANTPGRDITVYGKMVCEEEDTFVCNEPGSEHWLHIGDGEYDKVCLYENRQTNATPAVRVKGSLDDAYYLMLSEDPDMVIHKNSNKKMRIQRGNKIYNVCDKSSCPELLNVNP